MKNLSVLLFALCFTVGMSAQTFSVVENDTLYISDVPMEQYTSHYIDIVNTGAQELNMAWERISVDVPADWEYSLCDLGICYIGIPPGATVAQDLPVSGIGFFGINLTPHSEGNGSVQIQIWDTLFPDDKTLLTWYFSTGTVGVNEVKKAIVISAFPNPIGDVLYVKNDSNESVYYNLYNQSGQLLFSEYNSRVIQEFDCSPLSSGLYCLTANTKNYQTKIQLLKR